MSNKTPPLMPPFDKEKYDALNRTISRRANLEETRQRNFKLLCEALKLEPWDLYDPKGPWEILCRLLIFRMKSFNHEKKHGRLEKKSIQEKIDIAHEYEGKRSYLDFPIDDLSEKKTKKTEQFQNLRSRIGDAYGLTGEAIRGIVNDVEQFRKKYPDEYNEMLYGDYNHYELEEMFFGPKARAKMEHQDSIGLSPKGKNLLKTHKKPKKKK